MFCLSVNIRKIKIIVLISLVCIFLSGVAIILKNPTKEYVTLENNTSRVNFLNINGYDVSEEPFDCSTVNIPSEFNAIYQQYNKMQIEQGFDLSEYMGEEAEIYTYKMNDNPDMLAVLILHENNLIGCDIHTAEYGGNFETLIKN